MTEAAANKHLSNSFFAASLTDADPEIARAIDPRARGFTQSPLAGTMKCRRAVSRRAHVFQKDLRGWR